MPSKIGCVIAYRKGHNNYGTSLQGYAMLKKIQQLGFDIEVINYIKHYSFLEKVLWVINAYRCGLYGKGTSKKKADKSSDYAQNLELRTKAVDEYKAKKLLPYFHDYDGYKALTSGSKNYDAVVVGSDQVWLPTGLPTKFFNLLFVDDNVRKVAYASSFGVQEIPNFQKKATGAYLDRFFKIGVREQRGKEIVDSLSHKTAQGVADPTLLLTREEWEEEIKDARPHETEPYMFCYLISENEDARRKASELAKQKGLKIICIRHLEKYREIDETYGDEAPYEVDPNDFVKYIKDATYVVTDSFHCTVFSHIFHKQFLTFYRGTTGKNAKNSRIDSLIAVLGSNSQHLYNVGGLNGIDSVIDWDSVDKNLENLRNSSIEFLKSALE